ncbi:class I glutamine amidotransferase-like protein [Schizophyllum commune]
MICMFNRLRGRAVCSTSCFRLLDDSADQSLYQTDRLGKYDVRICRLWAYIRTCALGQEAVSVYPLRVHLPYRTSSLPIHIVPRVFTYPQGWYLPEAAHPYYVLAPHFDIDFAAPAGPNPPLDPVSKEMFKDEESQKFLTDKVPQEKLATAKKLADVNPDDYAAIFYVGGHGPVIDLATDPTNVKLASKFWQQGKIVSAVCHGPAALVGATDASGESIFKGRRATCFTYDEELQVKKVDSIPFQPEHKIVELGGKFEKTEPWGVKVVADGQLYTGQNPASAGPLGQELLKALKK